MLLDGFDYRPGPRIICGRGKIDRLGEAAAELGARRALLVSDPGVAAAGHTARGLDSLRRSGLEARLFDGVEENPTTRHVERGAEVAREHEADLIVALGGGSSMDCAKGINFLYSRGGRMRDYRGIDRGSGPMRPMIGVPTTAGTGSETQSFALICDEETHEKMACGDREASFRVAILDPEVTCTQPRAVTAATGIDALAHAVETFVSSRRNYVSRALSLEAWRLLEENFERVLARPDDLEARARMQLGAALAGSAIEHSMLGAAHALANPLTARHALVHGVAVGVMLPAVVRYNQEVAGGDYRVLAAVASGARGDPGPRALIDRLCALLERADVPCRLRSHGVERERLALLAREAAGQWTAGFNPRELSEQEALSLYEAVW